LDQRGAQDPTALAPVYLSYQGIIKVPKCGDQKVVKQPNKSVQLPYMADTLFIQARVTEGST
jgi:hypothetical protein